MTSCSLLQANVDCRIDLEAVTAWQVIKIVVVHQ